MTLLDPIPAYRFSVTLDAADAYLPQAQADQVNRVALADFQSVKGLSGQLEVTPYPEGGLSGYLHQLPVRHSWTNISLERGVVKDVGLWHWYQAGLTECLGARRDGSILLMAPDGSRAMSWAFRAGLVVKWNGPELNALTDGIAVESIEIAHHGVTQVAENGSTSS